MADGTVEVTPSTATNLVHIDNSMIGPTTDLFRQRVVLGDDSSSGRLAQVGSTAPAGTEKSLYVRQVGNVGISSGTVGLSSGIVTLSSGPSLGASTEFIGALSSGAKFIGSVDIASAVNLNVSLLTSPLSVQQNGGNPWNVAFSSSAFSATVGTTGNAWIPVRLTDGSTFYTAGGGAAGSTLVSLSSGASQIGSLGPSSAIVIGLVGLSSAVTLSSGAQVIGTVVMSSGLGASTAAIGSLTSGAAQIGSLGPSSGNVIGLVGLSSAVTLSSGAQQIGALGPSSGNVVGLVGLSSAVTLSSGALTLGTLTTGTVVGLTTTSIVGLSSATSNYVAISTGVLPILAYSSAGAAPQGQLEMVGGVVSSTGIQAAQTSGNSQTLIVDPYGRQIVTFYASFRSFAATSITTVSNTCQQQLIAAPGANTVAHITALTAFSSGGSTALAGTIVSLFSSSGQLTPVWKFPLSFVPTPLTQYTMDFDPPLIQPTANNPWWVVSSSSAVIINVAAQYFITTT